jgi:hypothetical protein
LAPFGVAIDDEGWRTNMTDEAEFSENRVNETPSLAVVGLSEAEEDRDVVADIHRLDDGEGSRLGRVEEGIGGAGVRRRGGMVGRVHHAAGGRSCAEARIQERRVTDTMKEGIGSIVALIDHR